MDPCHGAVNDYDELTEEIKCYIIDASNLQHEIAITNNNTNFAHTRRLNAGSTFRNGRRPFHGPP